MMKRLLTVYGLSPDISCNMVYDIILHAFKNYARAFQKKYAGAEWAAGRGSGQTDQKRRKKFRIRALAFFADSGYNCGTSSE
jgi:hypothetical protein